MMQHYRIKDVFEISRGRVISKEDMVENGKYPVYSSQTLSDGVIGYLNSYDFSGDYLTWTTDGACAGTVFKRHGSFNCTNVCGILKAKVPIDLSYAYLAVSIVAKENKREDIIGGKLMSNEMANLVISLPELSEQSCISGDIINKKNLINSQIEKLTQKLHHLEEYKTALIHNAVTKGLDANGNSLIGDDFISCRMKDLFFESNERSKSGDEVLLSLSKYHGIRPRNLVTEKEERAESLVGYKIVKKGDLVINKMLAWDKAIAYSDFDGIVSPDYSVYRHKANNKTQTIFCVNALKDNILQEKIRGLSKGIIDSRLRLNAPQFFSLSINMPSVNGIDRINKYCIDKISLVDEACHFTNKKIALLLEYKKSLINEAVSGQ